MGVRGHLRCVAQHRDRIVGELVGDAYFECARVGVDLELSAVVYNPDVRRFRENIVVYAVPVG